MKKILIFCFSDLDRDPRVIRQIKALNSDYNVFTAGYSKPLERVYQHFNILQTEKNDLKHWDYPYVLRKLYSLKIRLYEYFSFLYKSFYYRRKYWTKGKKSLFHILKQVKFDLIIANDISALPLCVKLSKENGAKLVFDAHEYYPKQFENDKDWVIKVQPYYRFLCKIYIKSSDLMTCVSKGIANEYYKVYNKNSVVITNATQYYELNPSEINNAKIRLVHHGMANEGRKLELMIEMFNFLDKRFSLDLYLVVNKHNHSYFDMLKEKVKGIESIKIHKPISFNQLTAVLNNYDVGIFFLPHTTINHKYALPNKFFEYVQARLAIAIGPSPEMSEYINKYQLGIVCNGFKAESLAKELNELTINEIIFFKKQSDKYAKKLSFETNKKIILNEVKKLIK